MKDIRMDSLHKHLLLLLTCLGLGLCRRVYESDDIYPSTEIIEIRSVLDEYRNISIESNHKLYKPSNSELEVGENTSRLLLKCTAPYPVQWIYLGDGRPEFTTFTNVKWIKDPDSPLQFLAEASLGVNKLREEDTGNYTCRSIQEPTILSYYYIYVPGSLLFTAKAGGENITFSYRDLFVRIPCSVSNPDASVTLHKSVNGRIQCPINSTSFDPKSGFQLRLPQHSNQEGVYVCTASYRNNFRIRQYNLILVSRSPYDPCKHNNPCGHQAECSVVGGSVVCFCFRGHSGNPYDRCTEDFSSDPKTCYVSQDCPSHQVCQQNKCIDPCDDPTYCGQGSTCVVTNRKARCTDCKPGYTGSPPFCTKGCLENSDCGRDQICKKRKCEDLCPGPCGQSALCRVVPNGNQRNTICSCPVGFVGDPLRKCRQGPNTNPPTWTSCPKGYEGRPPNCNLIECELNSDCLPDQSCTDNICIYPCDNACGKNADCRLSVSSRSPICTCPPGSSGNPLVYCSSRDSSRPPVEKNPCKPNPCLGFGECKVKNGKASCGSECELDAECPLDELCVQEICQDPCDSLCGVNAVCQLDSNRTSTGRVPADYSCACPPLYKGDPYDICSLSEPTFSKTPCEPSPCAKTAQCRVINGLAACKCFPGYTGDPYKECKKPSSIITESPFYPSRPSRPRPIIWGGCDDSDDCLETESCINNTCTNPCDSEDIKCALNAECRVVDHSASCRCPKGYVGDPRYRCRPARPHSRSMTESDSCEKNIYCSGSNSRCKMVDGEEMCVCSSGYIGKPPNCRLECEFDSHCFNNKACINNHCEDPCTQIDICAAYSECSVVDHKPLCRCKAGYTGVAWIRCQKINDRRCSGSQCRAS